MKKSLLSLSLFFILTSSFSQDNIYFIRGKKVEANVLEISRDKITFHLADDPDGVTREVSPVDVYMIKYRNGKEEIFGVKPHGRIEKYFSNGKNEYYLLSVGVGQSHGFLGLRFQHRWGGLQGWGYHFGIGVSPYGTAEHPATLSFSAGGKFFFFKGCFVDLQFGTFPIDKMVKVQADTGKRYYYNDSIRTAYGPSLMVGGDWLFNRYFGLTGGMGVSLNVSRPDFNAFQFAVDFGLIFRIPGRKESKPFHDISVGKPTQ